MTSFEEQAEKAGMNHLNTKIDTLATLLAEIKAEGYTEVYQVEGHINNYLDSLDILKGEQYQADANADHVTEQIPNV